MKAVETAQIAALLAPFLAAGDLSPALLQQVAAYLRLLVKWNARVNLTAVRAPAAIVTRHFGESFFLARALAEPIGNSGNETTTSFTVPADANCFDLGSGAGFPGLPLKLYWPRWQLTLIESNRKKAAFLNEVIRGLKLANANVYAGRAEALLAGRSRAGGNPVTGKEAARSAAGNSSAPTGNPDLVTMRAVERFAEVLPIAAQLLGPRGRLALLIGTGQIPAARAALPEFEWRGPVAVPLSTNRILLSGSRGCG